MINRFSAAGAVAVAATALVLSSAPAHAADQQFNQNLQVVPVQLCNANIGAGLGAVALPILSPQTTGDCINGPVAHNFG